MDCPKCSSELEIFAGSGKEVYVCPSCLCALLPQESSVKALKHFCSQEIMSQLISDLLEDSFFDNAKRMLAAEENFACPKCKSYMRQYDFNGQLRFSVNKCVSCGAIWVNQTQMPLVSVAFLEDNPEDANFKKSINNLYEMLAKRKVRKVKSFDEIIAPFAVITGLAAAIPTSDNVLTKTKPYATRALIIGCVTVFVFQFAFKEILTSFSLYADKVTQGEWYRLITSAFLHGNIFHILGNMFFLYIFGKSVEDELGWKKYFSLFAVGAVVSGIFFMATTIKKDIPCVGASGAISAIIGAYLILFPKANLRFSVVHPVTFQKLASTQISSLYYILSWIIMNVFFGALQSGSKTVGIAYWGHIGGFITGVIFIEVYKNLKRG